jgi:membrane fusion protein (multidrug efflux system)
MKTLRFVAVTLVAAVLGVGAYGWYRHAQRFPSTSDAYIGAHVVRIAPRIAGKIAELPVTDHSHVEKDQLLLALDSQPYEIAVQRAEANVALAEQAQAAAQASVRAARAQVREREAEHDDAWRNSLRMQDLLKRQSVAQAEADAARYRLREAKASLEVARSKLQQAVRKLDEDTAGIRVAEAALAQARMDLSHTRITAPASGVLGAISVRPGDIVAAGQQMFPLVEDSSIWVDANYKETELHCIKPGQPATVSVDMYPDRTFRGTVESLSPASGVAFALLPPENATGNWVKVTQRFPVRVRILDPDPATPLRIGASSVVTIDTTKAATAVAERAQNQTVADPPREPM